MMLDPASLATGILAGAALTGVPLLLLAARAKDSFRAASADMMNANNQTFLDLAEQRFGRLHEAARGELDLRGQAIDASVAPVAKTLESLAQRLNDVETQRARSYGEIHQHFALISDSHSALRTETGRLVQALRTPVGRGAWGEMQLERLLEISGMSEGVHYQRQVSVAGSAEERGVKPDIVVNLAGGKSIVIDAKTPMEAYLLAIDMPDDETRLARLKTHAANVRSQMMKLSAREYWKHFQPTPEFVVMFIPSEGACASALQHDLDLIEAGMRANVVIATPMTLFALLRTIVYGWRQEQLAENTAHIAKLGRDLYEGVARMSENYHKLGKALGNGIEAYNKALGQMEKSVLKPARALKDHGVMTTLDIAAPPELDASLKLYSAPEMLNGIEALEGHE